MNLCKDCNYPLRKTGTICPNCGLPFNTKGSKNKDIETYQISLIDIETQETTSNINTYFEYKIYRKKLKLIKEADCIFIVRKLNKGEILRNDDLILTKDRKILSLKFNKKNSKE